MKHSDFCLQYLPVISYCSKVIPMTKTFWQVSSPISIAKFNTLISDHLRTSSLASIIYVECTKNIFIMFSVWRGQWNYSRITKDASDVMSFTVSILACRISVRFTRISGCVISPLAKIWEITLKEFLFCPGSVDSRTWWTAEGKETS